MPTITRMNGKPMSVEETFFHWTNFLGEALHHCRESGAFLIRYRELTCRTETVIADLCLYAGVPFDPSPLRSLSFWQRKSHALGGNSAVIDQWRDQHLEMDGGREGWLGGKYLPADRWRKIHYDEPARRRT